MSALAALCSFRDELSLSTCWALFVIILFRNFTDRSRTPLIYSFLITILVGLCQLFPRHESNWGAPSHLPCSIDACGVGPIHTRGSSAVVPAWHRRIPSYRVVGWARLSLGGRVNCSDFGGIHGPQPSRPFSGKPWSCPSCCDTRKGTGRWPGDETRTTSRTEARNVEDTSLHQSKTVDASPDLSLDGSKDAMRVIGMGGLGKGL